MNFIDEGQFDMSYLKDKKEFDRRTRRMLLPGIKKDIFDMLLLDQMAAKGKKVLPTNFPLKQVEGVDYVWE
jgi:hypothetical protein